MMFKMKNRIMMTIVLALAAFAANAQDDFDPAPPPEPNARYKVTVEISNNRAGSVYGGGSYATGEEITISKSDAWLSADATEYFMFIGWTLNGKIYTTESSFTYVIGTENANFVARYISVDPDVVTSRVYVEISPADACDSYTTSGQRYYEGNEAYLYCYANEGFEFEGWYDGEQLVSEDYWFYYTVGKDNVTLTAKFSFNPPIPGEPSNSGQTNIDNSGKIGDINNDGILNIQDVVLCAKLALTPQAYNKRADIDEDGDVDQQDTECLANIILSQE